MHKDTDLPSEILTILAKLDEQADARMEERGKKGLFWNQSWKKGVAIRKGNMRNVCKPCYLASCKT